MSDVQPAAAPAGGEPADGKPKRKVVRKVVKKVPGGVGSSPPAAAGASAKDQAPPPEIGGHKYNHYERQVVDYVRLATRKNIWYYRDRMSVPRGPCPLPVLRECWVSGIIDENTLIWGQGLADWLPIRNVRTLVAQIRTPEVQAATWVKRTFALKPALEAIRKQRGEQRQHRSSQVDEMY